MSLKAAKLINSLVVLLMLLEIFGAALTTLPAISDSTLTIHSKKPTASVFAGFLFEKVEEETEKTDEEKGRVERPILIDFSWVAFSLSLKHTPTNQVSPRASQYNLKPPVYTLNCVFLI